VDLFITACEGGSNYWCESVKPMGTTGGRYERMLGGFEVVEQEPSSQGIDRYRVSPDGIAKGAQDCANKYPKVFTRIIEEQYDASDADVFLQCCTFGEVVYG
jgi:hypothetical protein